MSYSSFKLLDHTRPVLVFGRDGQVGRALQTCLKDLKSRVIFLGRLDCDLSSESLIIDTLNRYQPQVIINAAAYTAVDTAENHAEHHLAFAINAKAPALMARYVANVSNGILIHYSTDYVFADSKQGPYFESDPTGPVDSLCIYGQSKLAGEKAIEEAFNLANDPGYATYQNKFSRYFILRTSWVYGEGCNFIRTILRLITEHDQLKIVADQVGVPTSAQWLAEVGVQMTGSRIESGIYHAVPDGKTTWYGLAKFIIEIVESYGKVLEFKVDNIHAIQASEYPVSAKRPYNSRLNNKKLKKALLGIAFIDQYPHWRAQVEQYIKQYLG